MCCLKAILVLFLALPSLDANPRRSSLLFYLIYHQHDEEILTAFKYAAKVVDENIQKHRMKQTNRPAEPKRRSTSVKPTVSQPNNKDAGEMFMPPRSAPIPVSPISFEFVEANLDNSTATRMVVCRLMQERNLTSDQIIAVAYHHRHINLLRFLSRQFRFITVVLDRMPVPQSVHRSQPKQARKAKKRREESAGGVACTPFEIQMAPDYFHLLLDIIKVKQWTSFYFVHDSDEALDRLFGLITVMSTNGTFLDVPMREFPLEPDLSSQEASNDTKVNDENGDLPSDAFLDANYVFHELKRATADQPAYVVLDFKNDSNLFTFLRTLYQLDLFTNAHQYIISGLDFDSVMVENILVNPNTTKSIPLQHTTARLSGFHLTARHSSMFHQFRSVSSNAPKPLSRSTTNERIMHAAKMAKILRDWANLNQTEGFPGAGSHKFTARQALAFDFVLLLYEAIYSPELEPYKVGSRAPRYETEHIAEIASYCMSKSSNRRFYVPKISSPMKLVKRFAKISLNEKQTLTGSVRFVRKVCDTSGPLRRLAGVVRATVRGPAHGTKIYYLGQETPRVGFRPLGLWNTHDGLTYVVPSNDEDLDDHSKQMHKARDPNIKIVTSIAVEPFLFVREEGHGENKVTYFEGFIPDLTAAVAAMANFQYEIKLVADANYGRKNATGYWNGMVGEVVDGTADMAIAPLTITSQREKVVDFTKPFMTLGISIMLKRPNKQKPSVFSFLDPFSSEIWFCIGCCYIGVSVVLFVVSRFSPFEWHEPLTVLHRNKATKAAKFNGSTSESVEKEESTDPVLTSSTDDPKNKKIAATNINGAIAAGLLTEQLRINNEEKDVMRQLRGARSFAPDKNKKGEDGYVNDFTFPNALWFSLGAFMRQDVDIAPRSLSGRIVGSVWWFFTLIIISSYTANLAAFLTVERMLTPIESAEDLAKQTDIKYGTLEGGSTAQFFKTSKYSGYQRMWAFMVSAEPSVFVDNIETGIERVRQSKGKYAFLLESTMNEYINNQLPCETMKVGTNLDSKGYGIATAKGSNMKEILNLAVLRLRENGIMLTLEKKWWDQAGKCDYYEMLQQDRQSNALTLPKVAGVFYILIAGLAMALVTSLCEFFHKAKIDAQASKASSMKKLLAQKDEEAKEGEGPQDEHQEAEQHPSFIKKMGNVANQKVVKSLYRATAKIVRKASSQPNSRRNSLPCSRRSSINSTIKEDDK